MESQTIPWIGFNLFMLFMRALDLGVFHRKTHEVKFKEAVIWSAVWIALALIFNAGVWLLRGSEAGLQFLTGYLIEKSLSVDNIFVFLIIFSYFSVPSAYQHKLLFWGVLGALAMRGILIAVGVALIAKFHWIIYVFGALLILTAVKMLWQHGKKMELEQNPVLRLFRKVVPSARRMVRMLGFRFAMTAALILAMPAWGARAEEGSLECDGQRRVYSFHAPAGAEAKRPTPAVIVLHGAMMNGSMARSMSGMDELADEKGFIVVYPDGTGAGALKSWNAGGVQGAIGSKADAADDSLPER